MVIGLAIAHWAQRHQFKDFKQKVEYWRFWPVALNHMLYYCVALKGKELAVSSLEGHLSVMGCLLPLPTFGYKRYLRTG